MKIAIVGCGFVADLYVSTISMHPSLEIAGVYDRDLERRKRFSEFHKLRPYDSREALLDDPEVQIVLNLTNPRSHFEVSMAALDAGKHVYSEKPLAMSYEQASALFEHARAKGLELAAGPCTMLSETAQTLWRSVREGLAGEVRLVYAEMDEGMVHLSPYKKWFSPSGIPWPFEDEFETGCTLEHAGYCLTWLAAMFGPATSVTAFSSVLVKDKQCGTDLDPVAPDFSVACIKYASGVVARLTCGIVAPHDHRLRVVGDKGVLYTPESWSFRSPVYLRKWAKIRRRAFLSPLRKSIKLLDSHLRQPGSGGAQRIDFARGVAELAEAIQQKRRCRLSGEFALHLTELALAISNATEDSATYKLKSSFEPIEPLPWATESSS